MTENRTALRRAAAALVAAGAGDARVGLVLGSGLGAFGDGVEGGGALPYADIPGFPTSSVAGHKGRFVWGEVGGVRVAVLQGRVHRYEGWSWDEVVFPARVLATLGVPAVVLTNAAGGVNTDFSPGDLMLIIDHLNLTGGNPLAGVNDPELGPRFPDMTKGYHPVVGGALTRAAAGTGVQLRQGVYAGLLGPSYETPAEIEMLRRMGAAAVGMSTVAECIALNHMGVKVGGVSCITNMAAGVSGERLSHAEVKETASRVEAKFLKLLTAAVPAIDAAVRRAT